MFHLLYRLYLIEISDDPIDTGQWNQEVFEDKPEDLQSLSAEE